MKRYFNLIGLLLLSLSSFSQNSLRLIRIEPGPNKVGQTYYVQGVRNLGTYPLTSLGNSSWQTAVATGVVSRTYVTVAANSQLPTGFSVTPIAGCVIAVGVPAPLLPASCATQTPPPSWLSGLLYSHNGTTLTVKANGQVGKMSFAYLNGQPFTTTNPDGVGPLQNGVFYDYGSNSSPPGYDRQWQLNLTTLPMRIVAQKQGDVSQTASYTFSPSSGQTDVAITGSYTPPTSTTTPPVATTTTVSYNEQLLAKNQPGTGSVVYQDIVGPYTNSSQYRDYSFTAPGSGNLTMTLWYQTNWGNTGTGSGTYIVNGGTPVDFPLQGADGGNRTPSFTVPVVQGSNTIRVQGKSNTFYQNYINLAGTLSKVSGGTSTPPPSQTVTATSYSRVFVMGNSITLYGNGRGYDASTPGNDYLHILTDSLKTLNPNVEVRYFGHPAFSSSPNCGGQPLNGADGPYWEQHYASLPGNAAWCGFTGTDSLDRYQAVADWKPDLIIGRIGENVGDPNQNFAYHYKRVLEKFRSQNPGAPVVTSTSAWQSLNSTQVTTSNFIKTLSTQQGWPCAELAGITGATSGAENHPNDAAMLTIANRIWAAIPKNISSIGTPTISQPWTLGSAQLTAAGLDGNYVAAADQGWNIATTREKYIENNTSKIGFNRAGGIITYAALKRDNRILINTHQVGYPDGDPSNLYAQIPGPYDDLGRSWQSIVDYCWPGPNDNNGQGLRLTNGKSSGGGYKGHVFNTGGNPVQGGSMEPALDLSPILASATYNHPQRGIESYIRTRPKIWGLKNEDGWIVGEQWTWFAAPNVVAVFVRRTVEARDPARFVDYQTPGNTYSQENPCLYVVRDLTQKYINIPGEPRKNIDPGPNGDAPKYFTLDGRIGAYNGSTGVTYVSRRNTQVGAFNRTPEGYSGGEASWSENNTAYIQGAPARNYDNPGVYEDMYYVVLGSESEADAAIANLPGFSQNFDYDFTKEGMLFANYEGPLKRENGVWTLGIIPNYDQGNFGGYNAKMYSPAQAWQASAFTQINYEIAVTGTTSLAITWQKPGLNHLNEYRKSFTVQNDGQYHIVSVPTSDSNWNGIISRVGLGAGSGTNSAATVKIRRIWKN